VCIHHPVKKVIYERYIKRKGNSFLSKTYFSSLKLHISLLHKLFNKKTTLIEELGWVRARGKWERKGEF